MANLTFVSVYRLTWASQLVLTRLVGNAYVSFPVLMTSDEHSYQVHSMNPLSSDSIWQTTSIPPG